MNNPNNQITEADVIGFFRAATEKYAPEFPEVLEFCATHHRGTVGFFGYIGIGTDTPRAVSAYAFTFCSAAIKLRERIGPSKDTATKKREEAARLIAEADELERKSAA